MAQVSVILPTYNRAHLIGETIDSLLAQTRKPDEILVIDDGSEDGVADVLSRFGTSIRLVRQDNAGKAAALNRGLEMVKGDLIWICDDDDILLPEACALLAGTLEADPMLEFCAGRHLDFTHYPDGGAKHLRPPGYMRASPSERIFADLLEGCHIFQPGLMVRREVYEAVGPFRKDLVRSQDYEMLLRIARRQKGLQLDQVTFWHRDHDGVRGQAGQHFSAVSNADRWAEYNALIFRALLDDLADHELFARSEWESMAVAERPRLARVARATVEARQRMWDDALADFERAAQSDRTPLTEAERARVARATLTSLGTGNLLADTRLHHRLRRLGHVSVAGREMRRGIRRSMRWQFRQALAARDRAKLKALARFYLAS